MFHRFVTENFERQWNLKELYANHIGDDKAGDEYAASIQFIHTKNQYSKN